VYRSYYIVLPLAVLPSSTWQRMQKLAVEGSMGQSLRLPSSGEFAAAMETLPGMLTSVQVLVRV